MRPILRYAEVLAVERKETETYRTYVTDCLWNISRNTAAFGGGVCITQRFADILHPVPPDKRTPEQRFMDTIDTLGFKVKGVSAG